jgi:hypothetical protein
VGYAAALLPAANVPGYKTFRKTPLAYRFLIPSPAYRPLWPAQTGAGEGIRTPDPLITNQMLYQLSYASRRKLFILVIRNSNCKPYLKNFCSQT